MADPTIADVIALLRRIDLEQQQQNSLVNALSFGVQIMSQTADNTKASVDTLAGKVDAFIAAVQPAIGNLQTKLDAAVAQVTQLQQQIASGEPSPADAAELQATITEAAAESAKVDAALAALNPPATPAA